MGKAFPSLMVNEVLTQDRGASLDWQRPPSDLIWGTGDSRTGSTVASAIPDDLGSQWRPSGADQGLGCEQEQEVAALVVMGGGFLSLWNGSRWLFGTYVPSEAAAARTGIPTPLKEKNGRNEGRSQGVPFILLLLS